MIETSPRVSRSATESTKRPRRSLPLDVLRFVALLLVILHHAPNGWMAKSQVPTGLFEAIQRGGWTGVDLFFVLSGYLISGLLFTEHKRHGTIRVWHFYVRRGLKIYPAFYAFLATSVIVHYFRQGFFDERVVWDVLFLQSYNRGMWGHTWSLAIEEHFYIALPLLLILLARRKKNAEPFATIPKVCLYIAVVTLSLRVISAALSEQTRGMFQETHLRMDSLMFGVLLAYLHHYRTQRFEKFCRAYFWPLIAGGVGFWMPAFLFPARGNPYIYTLFYTQLYIGSGMILSALVVGGIPSNWLTRFMGSCGVHSYSIYLWHLPTRAWGAVLAKNLLNIPLPTGLTALAIYIGGSFGAGILLSRVIEWPVIRLRNRLFPSRSSDTATHAREELPQRTILPVPRSGSTAREAVTKVESRSKQLSR